MEKNETSRVIMVRHGESLGNAEGFFAGQTDIPLTPLGQRQAERTAEYLRDRKIDRIYSSDLIRSMQTRLGNDLQSVHPRGRRGGLH